MWTVGQVAGPGLWEWETPGDYIAAKAAGMQWIALRATNGDGVGKAKIFEAGFRTRSAAASSAGLAVLAWTQWYGPHDGPVSGDVSTYLRRCAAYTASLGLQAAGWIVDAEDRDLPGLGDALKELRTFSGVRVHLVFPGDTKTYGLNWDWASINASVDGLMPMVYSGMWRNDPAAPGAGDTAQAYRAAMAELDTVSQNVPRFPVCDETDPARIAGWIHEAQASNAQAISFFRIGVPGDTTAIAAFGASYNARSQPEQPAEQNQPSEQQRSTLPAVATQLVQAATGHESPSWWTQLTTTGSDGVEPGIATTEFLTSQATAIVVAIFGALTAFGVISMSDDQKKTVIQLVVAAIAFIQVTYTFGRSLRKGMASGSGTPPPQ